MDARQTIVGCKRVWLLMVWGVGGVGGGHILSRINMFGCTFVLCKLDSMVEAITILVVHIYKLH